MSDLLLIGRAPSTGEGNEFFLHCMDWWWDIYHVVETLLSDSFPVKELFYKDLWLAPPTPHLSQCEAHDLSGLLREKVLSGTYPRVAMHLELAPRGIRGHSHPGPA